MSLKWQRLYIYEALDFFFPAIKEIYINVRYIYTIPSEMPYAVCMLSVMMSCKLLPSNLHLLIYPNPPTYIHLQMTSIFFYINLITCSFYFIIKPNMTSNTPIRLKEIFDIENKTVKSYLPSNLFHAKTHIY